MGWSFDQIAGGWLAGSVIAVRPEEAVDAFDRVERLLGREWMEASRRSASGQPSSGSSPTLQVISVGQCLRALEGVVGAERLLDRLRKSDEAAWAELTAVYLFRSVRAFSVELYPRVMVGVGEREPDFRVRLDDDPWTYVEVASTNRSDGFRDAEATLRRIADMAHGISNSFTLEVFLRRQPSSTEVAAIGSRLPSFVVLRGIQKEELPDRLGFLMLNHMEPGKVVLLDHPERMMVHALAWQPWWLRVGKQRGTSR